jgi:hypothetical protein
VKSVTDLVSTWYTGETIIEVTTLISRHSGLCAVLLGYGAVCDPNRCGSSQRALGHAIDA